MIRRIHLTFSVKQVVIAGAGRGDTCTVGALTAIPTRCCGTVDGRGAACIGRISLTAGIFFVETVFARESARAILTEINGIGDITFCTVVAAVRIGISFAVVRKEVAVLFA